jgi:hypothetical protein
MRSIKKKRNKSLKRINKKHKNTKQRNMKGGTDVVAWKNVVETLQNLYFGEHVYARINDATTIERQKDAIKYLNSVSWSKYYGKDHLLRNGCLWPWSMDPNSLSLDINQNKLKIFKAIQDYC